MKSFCRLAFVFFLAFTTALVAAEPKPLRVMIITGGCCHDYGKQQTILKEGIEARTYAEVTLVHNEDRSSKARFEIYEKEDWAK